VSAERDLLFRLDDVVRAASRAAEILEYGREAVERDWKLSDLLIHELEIVGEACSAVPAEIRNRYAQVSWAGPIRMRNRLAHGYFDVALQRVWMAAERDLPVLKLQVESVISEIEAESSTRRSSL
jgi:uncharacterized protein with HEPN domain